MSTGDCINDTLSQGHIAYEGLWSTVYLAEWGYGYLRGWV